MSGAQSAPWTSGDGMFRLKAFRLRMIAAAAFAAALCHGGAARAQDCPGHPDALGTSRVLAVDAGAYSRVGTMQYKQTLPLADKEVAITFDDGPLPPYSNEILDILDAQCVKATFFIVGDMAKAFPDVVRREYAAGHTIGTHSASHPLHFDKLLGDRLDEQIDGGIAAVSAALGDPAAVAPFFRIPGLRRSETVEDALAARGLVVFGADAVADDWHHRISPAQIIERAMTRLEKHGRGILLLHDIHARTVAALPGLLRQLKERGFRVVQVVPGAPRVAANAPVAGAPAAQQWPEPSGVFAAADALLPAPDPESFAPDDGEDTGTAERAIATADWPVVTAASLSFSSATAELAAPSPQASGVSLQGRRLVGAALDPPPALHTGKRAARARFRHLRLHLRRRTHPAGDGQHAEALPVLPIV
jgi:peptidoglycan/xylan/chitin deacetylase (PgdA/CDA1 family)